MTCKEEYLNNVSKEIKFKAARKYLRRELGEHIDDKAQEFSNKGVPDAEAAAVAAMGDAKEAGRALNAVHRPRTEWGVIVCMLLLSIAGIAAAFAGPGHTYNDFSQTLWPGLQSILPVYLTLGLCLMVGLYFFDYTRLIRLRRVFFGTAFMLIAGFVITVIVFPHLDTMDPNNSTLSYVINYWELAAYIVSELFFILGIAAYIQHSKDKGVKGIIRVTILCAVSVFATALLSSPIVRSFLLAIVLIVMVLINTCDGTQRRKWLHFAAVSGTIIVICGFCLFLTLQAGTYSGILPSKSPHTMQDLLKGAKLVGASQQFVQNPGWYPPGASQYLITAIIVEFGWLAGIAVVLAFIALFIFMVYRSLKIADPFGRLLTFGITAFFFVRFALFALACTWLAGDISVVLPFVSCGSSYYVTDALLLGIFLSIWRRSAFMKKESLYAGIPA